MGALLLVVLSCNTFEETMVNLYTSVFGGLAWAQSPGLAAGVFDLYMITLENDEEELVQITCLYCLAVESEVIL